MGDVMGVWLVCRTLIEGVMIEALVILVFGKIRKSHDLLAEKSGYHKWFRLQMTNECQQIVYVFIYISIQFEKNFNRLAQFSLKLV